MYLILLSPNFIILWIISELLTLVFIGLSFTLFSSSFSSLLIYFLVQVFSSFNVFLFYIYPNPILFTVALLVKFGLFPFHSWFISASYRFPNFTLFLASTLHKLPFFYALIAFPLPYNFTLFLASTLFTTLSIGLIAYSSSDTRLLLVVSSVANNSWLFLSTLLSIITFSIFYGFYVVSIFRVLASFSSFTKSSQSTPPYLINLSGLPPLPLFIPKIMVICRISSLNNVVLTSFIVLFLVVRVPIVASYVSHVLNIILYSSNTSPSFID